MFRPRAGSPSPNRLALLAAAVLAASGAVRCQDFATFLGGSDAEQIMAIALDDRDRIVVVGHTLSWDFPASDPFHGGIDDAFVALIDPSQAGSSALVWSRLLGGDSAEAALDVGYSTATRLITVVGYTQSSNFQPAPTPDAYQSQHQGGFEGFVVQLDLQGSVVYSSFLGRSGQDRIGAVAVDDASGLITVAVYTDSDGFPVTPGAFQPQRAGSFDAFVARLHPTASPPPAQLVAATYLGGSGQEGLFDPGQNPRNWDLIDLHVATNGDTTVGGTTFSYDFPLNNPYQATQRGTGDLFVTRLDSLLQTVRWSTYFGGSRNEGLARMAVDEQGVVTLGGLSWGPLPTSPGAPQPSWMGGYDGVIAQLDPSATSTSQQLRYCTFVGGIEWDGVTGLALEPSGIITACGLSFQQSGAWNGTSGAWLPSFLPYGTGFALRLDPQGNGWSDVHHFTYAGAGAVRQPTGWSWEGCWGLALRSDGRVVLAGNTDNPAHPVTSGAPQQVFRGGVCDATLMILDLLPSGAVRYGASSPACRPPIYMQVNSNPQPGNATFELHCNRAPASAPGALMIGVAFPPGGSPVFGAVPYVAPIVLGVNATAGPNGFARMGIPIPANVQLSGVIGMQWFWLNAASCGGLLEASDALRL